MENNLQKYEVSFIHSAHRHTTWVMLSPETVPTLEKVYNETSVHVIGDVMNLCLMEINDDRSASSAGHLVETIRDAAESNNVDWTEVDKLADELDAQMDDPAAKPILVEFVWNCGGGDDNTFTQGFVGIPGSPLIESFTHALEKIGEESGNFYDFTSFDPSEGHGDDIGIEGLLDSAYEVGNESLIDFIKAVQAADYRTKLNELATPKPASPSPKVKM